MKPVLKLNDVETHLTSLELRDGKVSQVGYFDEDMQYHILNDSKHALPGKTGVSNLDSKVYDADDRAIKKLEQLLADETELLNDHAHDGMQDESFDLWKKSKMNYDMQTAKIEGIAAALKLVKG